MAEVNEYIDDAGKWLSIAEWKVPVLFAHIPADSDEESDSPITLFWPGYTQEDKLRTFFSTLAEKMSCGPKDRIVNVAYLKDRKLTRAVRPVYALRSSDFVSPPGTRFLRLEYYENETVTSSHLIAWAPLDRKHDDASPPLIGLFASPNIIEQYNWLIADYINNTSYKRLDKDSYSNHLTELMDHIPKPEPDLPLPA